MAPWRANLGRRQQWLRRGLAGATLQQPVKHCQDVAHSARTLFDFGRNKDGGLRNLLHKKCDQALADIPHSVTASKIQKDLSEYLSLERVKTKLASGINDPLKVFP